MSLEAHPHSPYDNFLDKVGVFSNPLIADGDHFHIPCMSFWLGTGPVCVCVYTHSAAYGHCIGTNKSHGCTASAVLHTIHFFLTLGDTLPVGRFKFDRQVTKFQLLVTCQPHGASCLYQNPFSPKPEIPRCIFWKICCNVFSSSNSSCLEKVRSKCC